MDSFCGGVVGEPCGAVFSLKAVSDPSEPAAPSTPGACSACPPFPVACAHAFLVALTGVAYLPGRVTLPETVP